MEKKEKIIQILNDQVNIFKSKTGFGLPWNVVVQDADGIQYFLNRQNLGSKEKPDWKFILGPKLDVQQKKRGH